MPTESDFAMNVANEASTMHQLIEIPPDNSWEVHGRYYEELLERDANDRVQEAMDSLVYEDDPEAIAGYQVPGYRSEAGQVNSSKTWYAWGNLPYLTSSEAIEKGYTSSGLVWDDYSKSVSYTPMLYELLAWTKYHTYMQSGIDRVYMEAGTYSGIDRTLLGLGVQQFGGSAGGADLGEYDTFWEQLQAADVTIIPSSGLRSDSTGPGGAGDAFIMLDFTLTEDMTFDIPNYTWTDTYDYAGATLTTYTAGEVHLPPGAIGILGKYEGNVGTDDQIAATTYNSDHNHEYVTTNNDSDMSFYWYTSTPDSYYSLGFTDDGRDADETGLLYLETDPAEREYLKSIVGTLSGGSADAVIGAAIDAQMAEIANAIHGLVTIDRYAYSRTKPQTLDANEVREFPGTEAPQNIGLSPIGNY